MNTNRSTFDEEMAIARRIMDERWIELRALALSDQHPELDAEALVELAKHQARKAGRPTGD